jgi:ABC-type Fe3+-hydroxamate transport system substrate-binding protein
VAKFLITVAFLLSTFTANAYANSWHDDAGVSWTKPTSPPVRWVVLGPHLVDMVEAIGAEKYVVGVHDDFDRPGRRRLSTKGYVIVGQPGQINEELLRRVKPDLIVYWPEGMSPQQLQRVKQLGIPVLTISPKHLDDIPDRLRWLGWLANRSEVADLKAQQLTEQLDNQRKTFAQGARLRAFYQVWQTPLYSLAPDHLVSQAMALCGADSIVPPSPVAAPVMSVEAILRERPDLILVSKSSHSSAHQFWSRFKHLPAVQTGAILAVNDKDLTRPGLSLLAAIPELCLQLKPWREQAGMRR